MLRRWDFQALVWRAQEKISVLLMIISKLDDRWWWWGVRKSFNAIPRSESHNSNLIIALSCFDRDSDRLRWRNAAMSVWCLFGTLGDRFGILSLFEFWLENCFFLWFSGLFFSIDSCFEFCNVCWHFMLEVRVLIENLSLRLISEALGDRLTL